MFIFIEHFERSEERHERAKIYLAGQQSKFILSLGKVGVHIRG